MGVAAADFVVVLPLGGRGTHTEMGMAIALGKRVFLWGAADQMVDERGKLCCFYFHPLVERMIGMGTEEFLQALQAKLLS